MSLLLAWIVFPIVLGLIAIGCGLLVQQIAGLKLPGALVPPLGLSVVIVAATLTTKWGATAQFATPLVVALAVAGLGLWLSHPWSGLRIDGWALVSAIGVFAVYAAPIVLSGDATFAGYITLDDTPTWLALTDRAMDHGRTLTGLEPSTYQQVLTDYFNSGYPLGAFMVLGIGGKLTSQDVAWLFQPTIALFGAMLALSIYVTTARLVSSRPLRALIAFLGAQPALLVAYALWSGIKELAAAATIALICALVAATIDRWDKVRSVIPTAFALAALIAILTPAGGIWLVTPAIIVSVLLIRRGLVLFVRAATVLVVLVALLSVPAVSTARTFIRGAAGGAVTSTAEVANLGHPLDRLQLAGIWPATDFRTELHDPTLTHILIAVLAAAAVAGLVVAFRRRAWGMPLYLATALGGAGSAFFLERHGLSSPWLNAKMMAEASPAIVTAAVAGTAAVFEAGRRTEAIVACSAIAAGVLWSNGLTYSNAWLAPHSQLAELETVGERYANGGPSLMTEYQPYGARHFLRALDPEAASERRRRLVPLHDGQGLEKGLSADLDSFDLNSLLVYRTFVLRDSPMESRPPSVYRLVWQGRWYEVWQRPDRHRQILEHLSLGDAFNPAAVPACSEVLRLGQRASGEGGMLAAVIRPATPIVVDLTRGSYPPTWSAFGAGSLIANTTGVASLNISVPSAGRYGFWIGGSFRRTLTLVVDGRKVGSVRHQLNNSGQWTPLGQAALGRGPHTAELRYGGSRLAPGSGGFAFAMGPLVASRETADLPVTYVDPANARSLCGKRLDWVEALGT